jgi:hypothetical protein
MRHPTMDEQERNACRHEGPRLLSSLQALRREARWGYAVEAVLPGSAYKRSRKADKSSSTVSDSTLRPSPKAKRGGEGNLKEG